MYGVYRPGFKFRVCDKKSQDEAIEINVTELLFRLLCPGEAGRGVVHPIVGIRVPFLSL